MRKEPEGFQVRDLPLDVGVLWGLAGEVAAHFPALRGAKVYEHRGGLPTISPDGDHIVGPVGTLGGFYIASACNVGGLSISASVGRALADLIVDGSSQPDLGRMSVERFGGHDLDEALRGGLRARLRAKVHEGAGGISPPRPGAPLRG
jgi:glycine/D-amino acid oxidase-like deaminating enzyme